MQVIDSHTGGQPTRVIYDGGPALKTASLSEQLDVFKAEYDHLRQAAVLEPRCSDAMVGALLCDSPDPSCTAGVIFFNTAGYLGMCGHGAIGVMVTLAHLGVIKPGRHKIDTPAGVVETELLGPNTVQIENVESYRLAAGVSVDLGDLGSITGSVAWGGNWFFLADRSPHDVLQENIPALTDAALRIRKALADTTINGLAGSEIDHIEFFGAASDGRADSKNFVLCPGGAYDRSPCGTGTSAKLACLAAEQKLAPGETWVQESIIGTQFIGSYTPSTNSGRIIPTITGDAHISAKATIVINENDPFRFGIK